MRVFLLTLITTLCDLLDKKKNLTNINVIYINQKMVLETFSLTEELHKYRRKKISQEFPCLKNCMDDCYLSLWKYFSKVPERFYSKRAYKDILKFLEDLKENQKDNLIKILTEYYKSFSFAFRSLYDINSLEFHDAELSTNEYEIMRFYDNYIHPNYLKLVESVFANLILPISVFQRIKREAKINSFDVYNRVEELRTTPYEYLTNFYNNTIRNGIAHGKIIYKQREIIYEDKRGNSFTLPLNNVINFFDNMLDICNGLSLGLHLFYITNFKLIEKNNINIPLPIMLEELRAKTNAPGWKIRGCLESETIDNESQLIIFSKNYFLDRLKLNYHVFRSAVLTERFAPGYKRYFFYLDSKYSLLGSAAFNGSKLHRLRNKKTSSLEDYVNSLENGIFFNPRVKLPRYFLRLTLLISSLKIHFHILWLDSKESDQRKVEIHRNKFHSIVNASVVVKSKSEVPLKNLIRTYCNKIIRKTVRVARRKAKKSNISKYLPLGYVKISVYSEDFRIRKLGNSGLIPELLCTIELKQLKRIRTVDIMGGIPETVGKFRIVWNKSAEI